VSLSLEEKALVIEEIHQDLKGIQELGASLQELFLQATELKVLTDQVTEQDQAEMTQNLEVHLDQDLAIQQIEEETTEDSEVDLIEVVVVMEVDPEDLTEEVDLAEVDLAEVEVIDSKARKLAMRNILLLLKQWSKSTSMLLVHHSMNFQ
jgi:hypothetical protein